LSKTHYLIVTNSHIISAERVHVTSIIVRKVHVTHNGFKFFPLTGYFRFR